MSSFSFGATQSSQTASIKATGMHASLLDLPAELRTMIWQFVLRSEDSDPKPVSPTRYVMKSLDDVYAVESPPVARVNKQIREETLPVYYVGRKLLVPGRWRQRARHTMLPIPADVLPTVRMLLLKTHPLEATYIGIEKGTYGYKLGRGGEAPLQRLIIAYEMRLEMAFLFLQYLLEHRGLGFILQESDLETLIALCQYPYSNGRAVMALWSEHDPAKKVDVNRLHQVLKLALSASMNAFGVGLPPLSQQMWYV